MGIIQQSFSLNLRIMSVLRMYPPKSSTYVYKVQAYISYYFFTVLMSILGILYFLLEENIDMMEVGDTTIFMFQSTCFIGKALPFVSHRIKKCVNYFENSCFTTHNDKQKKIMPSPLIGGFYFTISGTILDPLIGGLACQVNVLKDNPHEHTEEYKNNCRVRKFEITHGELLSYVRDFEECLSLSLFSQFIASSFEIGFCCLQLSMVEFYDFYAIVTISYIVILLAKIYFYCYYGTLMLEEGNSLIKSICMGNWYKYDIKSRTPLTIIMERSKRSVTLTAGKILDLSIETFATIIRRSYSLLSVLKNLQ